MFSVGTFAVANHCDNDFSSLVSTLNVIVYFLFSSAVKFGVPSNTAGIDPNTSYP